MYGPLMQENSPPGYIDYDPETQDAAIRKIVRILQAQTRDTSTHRKHGDMASRREIVAMLDTYKAAVVELTLVGSLNVDQCAELMSIVDRIVKEETTA